MRRRLTASGGGNWISIYDLPTQDSLLDYNTGNFGASGITAYGIRWKKGRSYGGGIDSNVNHTYVSDNSLGESTLDLYCPTDEYTFMQVLNIYPYRVDTNSIQIFVYALYQNNGNYGSITYTNNYIKSDGDYWVLLVEDLPDTISDGDTKYKSPYINCCIVSDDRASDTSSIVTAYRNAGVDVQVLVE